MILDDDDDDDDLRLPFGAMRMQKNEHNLVKIAFYTPKIKKGVAQLLIVVFVLALFGTRILIVVFVSIFLEH